MSSSKNKIFFPHRGLKVILEEDWEFDLWYSHYCIDMVNKLSKKGLMKPFSGFRKFVLPAGTILEIEKMNIWRDAHHLEAVSFFIVECPLFEESDRGYDLRPDCFSKFTAMIDDINEIVGHFEK
jgi:hypothetical protein